jgi:hypothetical protein
MAARLVADRWYGTSRIAASSMSLPIALSISRDDPGDA